MTPLQMETFIKAAQFGTALGLNHRYEWFVNSTRSLSHGLYTAIATENDKLEDAFLAFEKGTACCPEEEDELEQLTIEGLYERINYWYDSHTMVPQPS